MASTCAGGEAPRARPAPGSTAPARQTRARAENADVRRDGLIAATVAQSMGNDKRSGREGHGKGRPAIPLLEEVGSCSRAVRTELAGEDVGHALRRELTVGLDGPLRHARIVG